MNEQARLQAAHPPGLARNATFLGILSSTNAHAVAQVQLLTREGSAPIQLFLGLLDHIAGT